MKKLMKFIFLLSKKATMFLCFETDMNSEANGALIEENKRLRQQIEEIRVRFISFKLTSLIHSRKDR